MTVLPRDNGARHIVYAALAASVVLAGCSKGNGETVQGDVSIAYVMRKNTIGANPTNGGPTAPGGDLIVRDKSSASAPETNVTASITQGNGDAADPEVSYDGKKIVFALRCPTSNTSTVSGQPACTGHWNIWEYDMTTGGLKGGTLRRLTSTTTADDVGPAYLPAGRGFVFSSNRQTKSSVNQFDGHTYFALDEYERERVFNLHTMDAQGGAITQISVNQSHDRNPVVRPNGDIMFSRWDHVGGRNHFKVFRVKPDGTDMFVLYGSHSPGNSFLHPRDMDPNGQYKGFISSDLMPLSGTHEGGALVFIDAANFSENDTPANPTVSGNAQKQATGQLLNFDRGLSQFGRITTPYPLWDGTDRVLIAYAPCEVTKNGVVVSCALLTADEKARLSDMNRLNTDIAADAVQDNVKPSYAIYMFNPANQTFLIVASPPAGYKYTDPVAIQSRPEPSAADPTPVDPTLAANNQGLLEVRSVYDTDGLGRMGDPVIAAVDLGTGCTTAIAKTTPTDPSDTRPQIADLVKMKDPTNAAYGCAPARFVRAFRAVAPVASTMGLRSAIGDTDFEMQQILGYAPVEPDGSFKLVVPADTPIGLAIVDAKGRAFQTHTNWIQVRPGERRTCDGCHSPRRGAAINSGTVVNSMPSGLTPALASAHQSGETMASTRTRLDPTLLSLASDPVYTDVWAAAPANARAPISLKYTGNPTPADDLATTVPTKGIINYPEHIQPLWERDRGGSKCIDCHADTTKLDLRATVSGTGRLTSYEELMVGDPVIDPNTGLPKTTVEEGVTVIVRGAALVDTGASEGEAIGLTRKSRLGEIMFGEDLMSSADARTAHPNPPPTAPIHGTLLNAAEKRLLAEWMDLGGKYYNDPFNSSAGVRTITTLSQATFEAQVYPIMLSTCAANCHQAIGSANTPAGTSFFQNRLVLTGDPDGDFNVTLTMISDVCQPTSNYLLSRPSTIPHPAGAVGQATAVLPAGGNDYNNIATWIASGCTP